MSCFCSGSKCISPSCSPLRLSPELALTGARSGDASRSDCVAGLARPRTAVDAGSLSSPANPSAPRCRRCPVCLEILSRNGRRRPQGACVSAEGSCSWPSPGRGGCPCTGVSNHKGHLAGMRETAGHFPLRVLRTQRFQRDRYIQELQDTNGHLCRRSLSSRAFSIRGGVCGRVTRVSGEARVTV